MALFGFGKKKGAETGCDCGGACEPIMTEKEEAVCCCTDVCTETESLSKSTDSSDTPSNANIAVKVLGSGCAKCNQLEAATKEALNKLGMDTTIDHVTDFAQIASYGVMTTPALVIDGKVVSYGKVLKTEEVVKILEKIRG